MTAGEAAAAIRSGALTSVALVSSCLDRIEALEPIIGAWTFLDPAHALAQAKAADAWQAAGEPLGPLHGVPVGIKDIFDTADMPTENGTPLRAVLAGRRGTMAGPLRKARSALASLWALWALAGTTGQIVMIWATLTNDPSSDLTPEAVLDVASLLNVIAIAALMCLEPKAPSRLCRTTTVG